MKIVVPSYNRPNILREKTFNLLLRHHIFEWATLDIVVETKEMKKIYNQFIPDHPKINYIISNTKGICEKRNFVRWYYRHETDLEEILCLDDDIEDILAVFNGVNLQDLYMRGFELCKKAGATLWGINHLHNNHFMKKQKPFYTKLVYIQGGFAGIIFDRTKEGVQADVDIFEDFQFSLETYLRDGVLFKFNHYYLKTEYQEEVGGIRESMGGFENRKAETQRTIPYMIDRYGDMLKLKKNTWGDDLLMNPYYKLPALSA